MTFSWEHAAEVLPALLAALRVTVAATLGGMALALVLGLAWAALARSRSRLLSGLARWSVELVRCTPLLVQLYFVFYALPRLGLSLSGFAAGTLGLGLHYSAYVSEVYRAGIDGVARGQWEAATALGLSRWDAFRRIVLPQAIPPVIPALGNYLVAMFKDTPLLAAITVMEMLQVARLYGARTFRYLEAFTLVGLLFLVLSLVASRLVAHVERRLPRHA